MERLKIICLVVAFFVQSVCSKDLVLQFSWGKVNYTWPAHHDILKDSENDPNAYDNYIYQNNVIMGGNKWRNKVFVSVPRRRGGIPSTLNYVWFNNTHRHNVPLTPYPDWNTNRQDRFNDNKPHIVSAYRMAVDDCDRLWIMDDGRVESFGPSGIIKKIQQPSVVVIDLHTDKIIKQYFLKDTDLKPQSSFVNIAVDVDSASCNDAYAYLFDILGFGMVVYSFEKDDSWRVAHKYFHLESLSSDLNIAGMKFQWYDGIFSMGLSNKNPNGFRTAYFHVLAGTHIYTVSTEILRDKALATRSYHGDDLKVLFHKGPETQSSASDLHRGTGVLFFTLINQNGVGCWNTHKKPSSSNVGLVFRDDKKFIYPSDLKVSRNELIVTTDQYPIYAYKSLNYDEPNFRIWITNVQDAIENTVCKF